MNNPNAKRQVPEMDIYDCDLESIMAWILVQDPRSLLYPSQAQKAYLPILSGIPIFVRQLI
jgi:hypothetical protein